MSFVACPRCGGKAFRRADGKLLAHTTPAKGGWRFVELPWARHPVPTNTGERVEAKVCE